MKPVPFTMRLIEDRSIPEPNTGCWLWLMQDHAKGYGIFRNRKSRERLAHRASYSISREVTLNSSQIVRHKCDTPCCVNPMHLELGNVADNNNDTVRRGRHWQQQKTHCPSGHPYSPENTYLISGGRYCRICAKAKTYKYRAKKRQEANYAKQH